MNVNKILAKADAIAATRNNEEQEKLDQYKIKQFDILYEKSKLLLSMLQDRTTLDEDCYLDAWDFKITPQVDITQLGKTGNSMPKITAQTPFGELQITSDWNITSFQGADYTRIRFWHISKVTGAETNLEESHFSSRTTFDNAILTLAIVARKIEKIENQEQCK